MSANILPNDREQDLDLAIEFPKKLRWVVQENPKLQAELNGLSVNGNKISPKVVNKVVDCIKDL
ncbi:MAG: hypothetical protein KAU23_02475 [Anaerolineales bacterium]|nr:hypothetical protein [Anaerolineales bacterium]